jgi:phage terminase large subunit-like protein
MVGGGFAIGTHEEGREKIEESLVTLHDRLTVERVTQADHGELRRDIGAVDIPPEPGTQPGKEVPDVIHVSMG